MRLMFIYVVFVGGFIYFVQSQFSRLQLIALDAVGMAPTATPFASYWAGQGYDLFLKGDLEGSAAAYGQAVEQQPDNVSYIYEYGRVLIDLNRPANPDSGKPASDLDMALALSDHAIQVAPADVRGYTLKANTLVWLDRADQAIPVGLTGIEIDRNFAPLNAALSRAYIDIGRYKQGLDYGLTSIKLDPMDVDAHRAYAYALISVGQRDQAIQELEDAVTINPNFTTPYFELAIQYRAVQKFEEAVATYEKILSLQPRNAKALLRLCETYSYVGQLTQAQGYCEDSLGIDANYKEAHRQLGMVMYRRRNYEGSIKEFDTCQKLGSNEIECYYLRGLAEYYLGNCDDAWNTLNESLRRIEDLPVKEPVLSETVEGLRLVTVSCPTYSGRALPTGAPPTVVPTPLGGVGG
jgi:superkiller protein 3